VKQSVKYRERRFVIRNNQTVFGEVYVSLSSFVSVQ
jgi:hypothetical protein